jgi:hypothetical protein
MSGVERDRSRVKATGEVFTPTPLVQEMLDQLPPTVFTDHTKTFLEPSCGDGQFLSEVIIRKMENGSSYEQALATVYGIDLMLDNCIECIKRLYGVNGEPVIEILKGRQIPKEWQSYTTVTTYKVVDEKRVKVVAKVPALAAVFKVDGVICNIVCGDGLKYDYRFGTLPPPPPKVVKPKKKKAKKKVKKKKPPVVKKASVKKPMAKKEKVKQPKFVSAVPDLIQVQ